MRIKRTLILTLIVVTLAGCRTVDITEEDIFDAHRTITPATFDISPYRFEGVRIDTPDGETLDSWFLSREDAVATVIYFGGNGSLMVKSRPLIQAYSTVPVNLLLFDYRGYGLSTGEPSVKGIYEDARAVFQFATNEAAATSDKIYVHGHSMGSFLSAMIADDYRVDGYILESPVTNVDQWTKKMIPWALRLFIRFNIDEDVRDQNNLDRVAIIEAPLLILSGTADDVTPVQMADELYEKSVSSSKNLVKINGGGHNNLPRSATYRQALSDFFR